MTMTQALAYAAIVLGLALVIGGVWRAIQFARVERTDPSEQFDGSGFLRDTFFSRQSGPLPPPSPILHAPDGFGDAPPPRKRSWTVAIGVGGLLAFAASDEIYSWHRCARADPADHYCDARNGGWGLAARGGSAAGARSLSFGGFGRAAGGRGGAGGHGSGE